MKEESAFQRRIVDCLKDNRQYVVVGAIAPGHPDLTTFKDGHSELIEVKDITGMSDDERFGSCFTRAQLPWMMSFQRHNWGVTFLAIKRDKQTFLYIVDSMQAVSVLKDKKVKDVLVKSFEFFAVMPMVNYILKG